MLAATVFLQSTNFIDALYIVAFSLLIYGMSGLTGPRTAVRGNKIAAVGMAVAVVATLLRQHVLTRLGHGGLILRGAGDRDGDRDPGGAAGCKMTAMPQMVALFNGVGGGAVALIAWVEYRHHFFVAAAVGAEGRDPELFARDRRVDLVLGLGHRVRQAAGDPARPADQAARASRSSTGAVAVVRRSRRSCWRPARTPRCCSSSGSWSRRRSWATMVVLPIGGADMPVVISLLNAFTGLSAAATGVALDNTAMIVAGMIVGASGTILTNLMAKAMNRSVPAIVAGGFGGAVAAPVGGAGETGGTVRSTSRRRTSRSSSPTRARW